MADKRYQVFVSSTYEDLKVERQEVMQALLALNCIPSGMELFPAADETQWDLIKSVIDDCDYYILIVAGRYGSLGPDDLSYTEMEYDYAISAGKPTLAFVHGEPEKLPVEKCESTDKGREKLKQFREKLRGKLYKRWTHPKDLKGEVAVSIGNLIKSKPAIGWIRANEAISSEAMQEINKLRQQKEELETRLQSARTTPPAGSEALAKGPDEVEVGCGYSVPYSMGVDDQTCTVKTTWDELFKTCGPGMLQESSEATFKSTLNRWTEARLKGHTEFPIRERSARILEDSFNQIKIQLIALGLIQKSEKPRSIKDAGTYWSLTSYGEQTLMSLLAAKRMSSTSET